MLTKAQKKIILSAFKIIDVKKLEIDYPNDMAIKWFRFGSYNGLQMAAEIIKQLPETKPEKVS